MAKPKSASKPRRQKKHPENRPEQGRRSAAAIKELTERLADFSADELAQIPIIAVNQRLRQGAVYLDLRDPAAEPITATGDMTATKNHLYAAKAETPREYWNRLVDACRASSQSGQETEGEISDETVDQTLEDSFPTSDPPAWTTGRERPNPDEPQAPREKRAAPGKK